MKNDLLLLSVNANYITSITIISIFLAIVIVYFILTALKMLKQGGLDITEAAQEIDNKKLHIAGKNIAKGSGILYNLYLISIVLPIIIYFLFFVPLY